LAFRAGQFGRLEAVELDFAQLRYRDFENLIDPFRIGAGIDAKVARVDERRNERVDAVDAAALLAHFLEQPRRHAAAERGVKHVGRVAQPMRLADTGAADADMRLLEFLFARQHQRDVYRWRKFFDFAVAGDTAEQPGAFRGQAFVLDLARRSDKNAARAVARRHERHQQLAVDFIYRLDRAENRQRERMAF